jgi:hypothetical protein
MYTIRCNRCERAVDSRVDESLSRFRADLRAAGWKMGYRWKGKRMNGDLCEKCVKLSRSTPTID